MIMCFAAYCGLLANIMSTEVLFLVREDPSGRRCGSSMIMKWIAVGCCGGTMHEIIHNAFARGC